MMVCPLGGVFRHQRLWIMIENEGSMPLPSLTQALIITMTQTTQLPVWVIR
jgi:hypothetical protein